MTMRHRWLYSLLGAMVILAPYDLSARETESTLNQKAYQQRCLLCHMSAAPEGVAPRILTGLRATPGRKPEDVMPGVECWRRCEQCWPQDKTKKK